MGCHQPAHPWMANRGDWTGTAVVRSYPRPRSFSSTRSFHAHICTPPADRRPIDPPPIVQLRVVDPSTRRPQSSSSRASSPGECIGSNSLPSRSFLGDPPALLPQPSRAFTGGTRHLHVYPLPDSASPPSAQSFLQNPYYFMFASLAKPDEDVEIHWLKVRPGVCPPRTCSGHLVGRFSLLLVTRESRRGGCSMICRRPASGGREERSRMGPRERTCPYLRTGCIINSASLLRVSS